MVDKRIVVPTHVVNNPANNTATLMRTTDGGIRLRKTSISRLPRASAHAANNNTANVVTRIPPDVEPEPPPINISASINHHVSACISEMLTTLKPPMRVVNEPKKAAWILPCSGNGPKVPSLRHSKSKNAAKAITVKNPVMTRVNLVCKDHDFGRLLNISS